MGFGQAVACAFGACPPPPPPPDEETDWATWGRSPDILNTCERGTNADDDPYLNRKDKGDDNAEDNHIPEDQVKKGCPDGDNRWGLCPIDGDGNAIDTEDDTIFHASKVNWHRGVNNPYLDQTGERGGSIFTMFRGGEFPTTGCAATRFALDYCANVDDSSNEGKYGPIWDGSTNKTDPVSPEKRLGAYWYGDDLEGQTIAKRKICECYEAAKYANGMKVSAPLLNIMATVIPECMEPLDHEGLATKFCKDPRNFNGMQIGNTAGDTCITRDTDGSVRKAFCKLDGNIKSDGKCTKTALGEDVYEEVAKHYCDSTAALDDSWCKCYNLTSGKCEENGLAYGCYEAIQELEKKKDAFGMDGYNILRANIHCRPRACTSGYIPKERGKECKSSYHFCDQDIDIRTLSDSDIILKCQLGDDDSLPPFMQNPNTVGKSRLERLKKRYPPFDTFPLNKTQITRWPITWRWSDPNVRYIAGYSVSMLTSCIMCIMLIFMSGRR